jgi:hypothetical protein
MVETPDAKMARHYEPSVISLARYFDGELERAKELANDGQYALARSNLEGVDRSIQRWSRVAVRMSNSDARESLGVLITDVKNRMVEALEYIHEREGDKR